MKRFFDIFFSIFVIVLGFPFAAIIAVFIAIDSRGGILYKQKRVGRNNKDFNLLKFRTMQSNSDKSGLLTVGNDDKRITKVGSFLRKYKIDEFPQFINILKGDMSIVGPRPEVRKYVDLYSTEQLRVLSVRPGLTDYASIRYVNENEILAASPNPEQTYIDEVMPDKLKLNLKYIDNFSVKEDIKIIFQTIIAIFKH